MRKPPPILGTHEIDYRLGPLFVMNHERYLLESQKHELLEKRWEVDKGLDLYKQMFEAQHARFEAGVITLLSATSLLERVLYEFASNFMHFESYESHLDRLKLETKWIMLPKLCAGIVVEEDSTEINELRQLIKARNAVVHPKVQFIRADTSAIPNTDKELARFHIACKNARRTVDALFALLNKTIKPSVDPACLI